VSHAVVQRTVVRMLYDPEFARRVYADRDAALDGLDLTAAERAALVRPDARAYGTDAHRRARALHGLLEEFAAAATLFAAASGDVRRLDAFFSAPEFHECIIGRGSLAAAFGAYLAGAGTIDARVAPIAALEAAVAALRRASAPAASTGEAWILSPHHPVIELPGGTLALFQSLMNRVRSANCNLVEFLLAPPARNLSDSLDAAAPEFLLLERAADEVHVEPVPAALGQLLAFARGPARSREALVIRARELGAEGLEADDILEELIADGVLVACPYLHGPTS
jgi:hypothetical protein